MVRLSFLVTLWAVCIGRPARALETVTLEQVSPLPRGWSYLSPADVDDPITLYVALAQPQLPDLVSNLIKVSDPAGPSYGSHLTHDDVQAYRAPSEDSVSDVQSWLEDHGINDITVFDAWIGFETTIGTANTLLAADIAYYAYESEPPALLSTSYGVPASLKQHVDFVFPLAHFMPPVKSGPVPVRIETKTTAAIPKRSLSPCKKSPTTLITTSSTTSSTTISSVSTQAATSTSSSSSSPSSSSPTPSSTPCVDGTTPACLRELYGINYTVPLFPPSPVRLGITGFLDQWPSHADATLFLKTYAPEILAADPDYNYTVVLTNNGTDPDTPSLEGMEAAIDIDYSLALGYPATVTFYSDGGVGPYINESGQLVPPTASSNEPYLEFLQWLLLQPPEELPHVLSVSYSDAEMSVPLAYATRVCGLLAQVAARGVTVLVATGDGGATGTVTDCIASDGSGREMFVPTFPASCPYVTAVGSTKVTYPTGKQVGAIFSAGGFSNYFARPSYQDAVVLPYLASLAAANGTATTAGLYNASGRAIPDISVVGTAYEVIWLGDFASLQGTSASTPVMAAMVALLNDARLRSGKPPLGWLNPTLYSTPISSLLEDITAGQSYGCYFDDIGEVPGWEAGPGFDCVTGLGTVKSFGALLEALG